VTPCVRLNDDSHNTRTSAHDRCQHRHRFAQAPEAAARRARAELGAQPAGARGADAPHGHGRTLHQDRAAQRRPHGPVQPGSLWNSARRHPDHSSRSEIEPRSGRAAQGIGKHRPAAHLVSPVSADQARPGLEGLAQGPRAALGGGHRRCARRASRRTGARPHLPRRGRSGHRAGIAGHLVCRHGGRPDRQRGGAESGAGAENRRQGQLSAGGVVRRCCLAGAAAPLGSHTAPRRGGWRPCADGRVALAALEPHFAAALCTAAGLPAADIRTLFDPATHAAIAAFLAGRTRRQLNRLATRHDIPLHTLPS